MKPTVVINALECEVGVIPDCPVACEAAGVESRDIYDPWY
jgi:hypothetical protein